MFISSRETHIQTLPPTGALMSFIYDKQKDEDGFLYITYSDSEAEARAAEAKQEKMIGAIEVGVAATILICLLVGVRSFYI
jgi:uncharacterized membrane protein YkgB